MGYCHAESVCNHQGLQMKKVFVLRAKEDWICDRLVDEWTQWNGDITTSNPVEADVLWILSEWCWKQIPYALLQSKRVVVTIHHIVPEKFGQAELNDFMMRDKVTDLYHVYNDIALQFISKLTTKPIKLVHYWANNHFWQPTELGKYEYRKKYNIPMSGPTKVIGSFQRDTEGHDLISPKLEKGPDLLVEFLKAYKQKLELVRDNIHVVLAGWRRQYVIKGLQAAGIQYTYFERPPIEQIKELYQTLDFYVVSARCEGGPQALIECGLLGVPVISTPVGIATQVLPKDAVNVDLTQAIRAVPDVTSWHIPVAFEQYRKMFEDL